MWILLGALALFTWLAVGFYLRSVESRRTYRCDECGEQVRVELMSASRCNTCGAALPVRPEGGAR